MLGPSDGLKKNSRVLFEQGHAKSGQLSYYGFVSTPFWHFLSFFFQSLSTFDSAFALLFRCAAGTQHRVVQRPTSRPHHRPIMDRLPDPAVQHSTATPSPSALPSYAGVHCALMRSELLERLRVCAALDRRFFKAWFDELDIERCSNFSNVVGVSSDLCVQTEWNEGLHTHDRSCQEADEAASHRISFELQDLEERERRLTEHAKAINRQYEDLMAELTEPAHNGAVRVSGCPVPPDHQARGMRRLPRIAMVISAKEEEQKSHLYHLRHWNVNISGVNIPSLPGLLLELPADEDV